MRRVPSCLAAIALSVLMTRSGLTQIPVSSPGAAQPSPGIPPAPARDTPPKKPATAVVRGRVVASDTGQPLRRASLSALAAELHELHNVTTDRNGRYEFTDLPGGRYTVLASKVGYVTLIYGQRRPLAAGQVLNIRPGELVERIDFALPRGGVIVGRVLDEFGDPAGGVQVAALRSEFAQRRRHLRALARVTTNDIGEYRLFDLPPSQYYVSASRPTDSADESRDRSGYAPAYYPAAGSPAEAQRLHVGAGQTLSDINVTLSPVRTSRISGTAIDSRGEPLAGGSVTVDQPSDSGFESIRRPVRPDGSFTVSNLVPGQYMLRARTAGPIDDLSEFGALRITVGGDDLTDLTLTTARPSTVTGHVVLDSDKAESIRPSLWVYAMSTQPGDGPATVGDGGDVNRDWTFELRVLPGTFLIRSGGTIDAGPGVALNAGILVKAVRLDGADITDSGIEFRPNTSISGVEVELTTHGAEVSGIVTDERGHPANDCTVIVFPQDRDRWTEASRYVAADRPDQDGRFTVRTVPPGEYYAIALDSIEPGEWADPDLLERVRPRAAAVSLTEGKTTALDLKVQTGG
ncbi:MAG TPA: carboxypeptidase-like regulatory domain-containing protein [Vicinamibacterales bacterium]|nr:carboxypeptidase-like regulatory domain-containing protein [Vicinamibacterales bacterium]